MRLGSVCFCHCRGADLCEPLLQIKSQTIGRSILLLLLIVVLLVLLILLVVILLILVVLLVFVLLVVLLISVVLVHIILEHKIITEALGVNSYLHKNDFLYIPYC